MFGAAFKVTGRLPCGGVTVLVPVNGLLHTPGYLVYPGEGEWLASQIRGEGVSKAAAELITQLIMEEV